MNIMDKQLQNFLKNKREPSDVCIHGKDEWCQNCINHGEYFDFREAGLGHGTFFTNKK